MKLFFQINNHTSNTRSLSISTIVSDSSSIIYVKGRHLTMQKKFSLANSFLVSLDVDYNFSTTKKYILNF